MVRVCLGTACYVRGGKGVLDALKNALRIEVGETSADREFSLEVGRCFGVCGLAPAIMIDDVFYENVKPADVTELVGEHIVKGRLVERLTHKRPDGREVSRAEDMDFFKRQTKIVLRNCGKVNPQEIEDYIARDGYQALARVRAR